ncbi:MAG: L-glyceraldehyde 3-phosphate reductase [Candidatus Heimdallarchaeota archaeon LC_2]|nr:MAG: L-glyceraldehyde 3-phosphate reductase [Candidatus Heimdallarchaeota archaeon LC_2]
MDYKSLGNTGIKVSEICLGTMQFGWTADKTTSHQILDKAVELGINFIDTANLYSRWSDKSYAGKTEEIIGNWLKETGNRDDLILATKVKGQMGEGLNDQGLSRRHIHHQVKQSLKRLKTKWIDLYQSHSFDESTPIKETLEVYTDLIREGKVNYIGASNYPAWKLVEALHVSEKYNLAKYQSIQPYYSLARRLRYDDDLREVCVKYNVGVIPYSPLAAGFLTGKYKQDQELPQSDRATGIKNQFFNERGWAILEILENICSEKGITTAQGGLAWVMQRPGITSPIIGANTVEQLEETIKAVEITFTEDEMDQLNEVSSIESNLIIS